MDDDNQMGSSYSPRTQTQFLSELNEESDHSSGSNPQYFKFK